MVDCGKKTRSQNSWRKRKQTLALKIAARFAKEEPVDPRYVDDLAHGEWDADQGH